MFVSIQVSDGMFCKWGKLGKVLWAASGMLEKVII